MKKFIIPLSCVLVGCIAVCAVLIGIRSSVCAGIYDQTAAERWKSGERNYVQHSVFIAESANAGQSFIMEMRGKISEKLAGESVTAENENADLYFDAFSAKTHIGVSRAENSAECAAYFTGGDFFRFHSLDIVSGWYYNEHDLMDDGVLINTYAAWKLYGGYDIVGKEIEVSGYPCIVYGVFDDSEDNDGMEPVIYASYSLLYKMGQKDVPITCYETVLPELVSGFGENVLNECISLSKYDYELLKNTGRFGFFKNLREITGIVHSGAKESAVYYPAWENSARSVQLTGIILAFFAAVFAVFPILAFLAFVCVLFAKKGEIFQAVRKKAVKLFKGR